MEMNCLGRRGEKEILSKKTFMGQILNTTPSEKFVLECNAPLVTPLATFLVHIFIGNTINWHRFLGFIVASDKNGAPVDRRRAERFGYTTERTETCRPVYGQRDCCPA